MCTNVRRNRFQNDEIDKLPSNQYNNNICTEFPILKMKDYMRTRSRLCIKGLILYSQFENMRRLSVAETCPERTKTETPTHIHTHWDYQTFAILNDSQ